MLSVCTQVPAAACTPITPPANERCIAVEDRNRLISVLSLPADTRRWVRRSLQVLEQLPLLGPELSGRWTGLRFLLGPWRWMLLVYRYETDRDRVVMVSI